MPAPVIPGAEPFSHVGEGDIGALVLHGFTGNPGSMRELAEACARAGFHVELPQLAGHGTAVEDMIPTRWADWTASVEAAYSALAARASRIVVLGLSMGGSLTLWTGLQHPSVRGLVCVNPATQPQAPEVLDMLKGMIDAGTEMMDGIGSDIADPDVHETAYPGTPLAPAHSFMVDGLMPMSQRFGELKMPLLLFTSVQDHVVNPADSDALAASYGGPVERVILERSYHVATQDYDKFHIFEKSVDFVRRVTA
ncbi:MAG: alpha/beta hydrolase [Acidimicrobiales bacterium]